MFVGKKFCSWFLKTKVPSDYVEASKKAKFHKNKPFLFRLWFLLNIFPVVAFLCRPKNILMFSWGIERKYWTKMG